ncbi:sel1 repeat family protein [Salinimonas sp. HHU 13199]|uniref:Sel1 repeat family protein n=1 Tax=Salinimonas profundi TaxID=2729140 RepID=A0ABR8LMI0_9ALTE|nr:SEL1-like repeat protein [Salinimonas profundi]MBD3586543.1 sel1 repeat family protein [Salinimonas profundi]
MKTRKFATLLLLCAALVVGHARAQDTAIPDTLITQLGSMAESDNAEAMYHLGMLYNNGVGVPRSPSKALAYFRRAAEKGDALGQYKLGCYLVGQFGQIDGLQLNKDEGMKYKQAAADAGYALAQYDVAGVRFQQKQWDSALEWLTRAAKQGYRPAMVALAGVYSDKQTPVYDPVSAWQYFLLIPESTGSEWLQTRRSAVEAELSAEQKQKAADQKSSMQFAPTVLTKRAQAGLDRAKALIKQQDN